MNTDITEEKINQFAQKYSREGEKPLVGVFGTLKDTQAVMKAAAMGSVVAGAAGGAASIFAIKRVVILSNDNRIVVLFVSYVSPEAKDQFEILKNDIGSIKIKPGFINNVIEINLKNGSKLSFLVSKIGVPGQPTHKERLAKIISYLNSY